MFVTLHDFRKGICFLDDTVKTTEIVRSPTWKWLPGDYVNPETGTVFERSMKHHTSIVGIVDFLNRTRCGFTKKGIPLYYFHPLDTAYPTMIVSSKSVASNNQFAVASIEHWEDTWPRAGIQTILGNVGDKAVEERALIASSGMSFKGDSVLTVPDVSDVYAWDVVLNIDPDGCEDVDDVFCWKHGQRDGDYEFAIAIADVSAWIEEGSSVDTFAQRQGETVYVDGRVIFPMLPTELSCIRASLRCDSVARPVVAYVYTISQGVVQSVAWKCMNVRVREAHTYETIRANDSACSVIKTCLTAIYGGDITEDTHRWVEIAMIEYNCAVALLLHAQGVGILRSHAGVGGSEWKRLAQITGCSELAHMGTSKGSYVYSTETHVEHSGLQRSVYCHASSPLRRYSDLVNQRWLKHICCGMPKPLLGVLPSYLNYRSRIAKSLERNLWFLRNLRTDALTDQEGFLISFNEVYETWSVYVPLWKRSVRAKYQGNTVLESGMKISIQVYTNLACTHWSDRIVCSILEIL